MKTIQQLEAENKILRNALNKIANKYYDPQELQKISETEYGLNYEEALEMTYENLQAEARAALYYLEKLSKSNT